MKILLGLLMIFVIPASHGTTLKDFSGNWKGSRTEYVNGHAISFSETVGYRYRDNGLVIKANIRSGSTYLKATGEYSKDGSYSSSIFSGSTLLAVASGSWKLVGKTIKIKATANYVNGSIQSANSSTQLVSKKKLVVVSVTSGGTVTLVMRRLR